MAIFMKHCEFIPTKFIADFMDLRFINTLTLNTNVWFIASVKI